MSRQNTPLSELARQLRDIDKELVALIAKRAVLVAGAKPSAPGQTKRKQWQELEKELWQLWEQEAQACRSDVRSWRKLFSLLQELTAQEEPENASRSYVLSPRREAMRIDMRGPGCTLSSRLWSVLAAQARQPLSVSRVLRNDPLVELVKALNQAGASLYWDDEGLHSRGTSLADFGEGVIFAGENSQNLLLLVGLCLGRAGAARFTGGAGLKLKDFAALRNFLPQLGARIAFMHPGSSSVPFRLEASGVLPESVKLPADFAPELAAQLALALLLAAPSYGAPFTLQWGAEQEELVAPLAATASAMLAACGVQADVETGACTVQGGEVKLPEKVELPLDPFIATTFLATPLFSGGEAVLRGEWPDHLPQWRGAAALLESAGLELKTGNGRIASAPKQDFSFQEIALGLAQDLLPLAVSLAGWHALQAGGAVGEAGRTVRLRLPRVGEQELGPCVELAELMGLELLWDKDIYSLRKLPGLAGGGDALVAQDGRWCLGAALASFCAPGLQLANPGEVSDLMPTFWKLFNALPDPGRDAVASRKAPAREENGDGKKRRRRIVPR